MSHEQKLQEGQKIQALVKISVQEILEKPRKFLVDFLAMHALGVDNIGIFFLDEFIIDPVGMVKKDIVFEVSGIVKKQEQPTKQKKPVKKKNKTKKT
jgi:hypothetical protein